MVSPASVRASPRPDLWKIGVPAWSSSFLSWALTADVDRPRRSAALAKLPRSIPVAKLRRTSRSKFTRRTRIVPIIGIINSVFSDFKDDHCALYQRRQVALRGAFDP